MYKTGWKFDKDNLNENHWSNVIALINPDSSVTRLAQDVIRLHNFAR